MLRRVKIRFARAQSDDVFTLCLELGGASGDRESGGGFDGLYAFGQFQDVSLRSININVA
jgi:hypothetical protein